MTVCRCGVDIRWCNVEGRDDLVPVERTITETMGEHRYAVTEYGERWTVKALDPKVEASGHPDHRQRCPLSPRS